MIETDTKQTQKEDWLRTHTLTPDQLKQLIQNKFVRAVQYRESVRKREMLCGGR